MKLVTLYIFLIAVLSSACCASAEEAGLPVEASPSLESANSSQPVGGDIFASTLSALNNISHSANGTKRKGLYIIGQIAISHAEKNLENVSREGQRIGKIPIKFYDYDGQNPPLLGNIKPGLDYNFTTPAGEYLEQAPPSMPVPPVTKPSEDIEESQQGSMNAIWKP